MADTVCFDGICHSERGLCDPMNASIAHPSHLGGSASVDLMLRRRLTANLSLAFRDLHQRETSSPLTGSDVCRLCTSDGTPRELEGNHLCKAYGNCRFHLSQVVSYLAQCTTNTELTFSFVFAPRHYIFSPFVFGVVPTTTSETVLDAHQALWEF
jgi:hypothetical protein